MEKVFQEPTEEKEEVRRPSEEHGEELQRMKGVEHATTDDARGVGGSEEQPGGHQAAKNSATSEHSLRPRDDPGRPSEADMSRVGCVTMCRRLMLRPSNEAQSCSKTWRMTSN